jgi:biotin--protein ligase
MKKILIYRDEGADPFGIASLVSTLKQENVDKTFLLSWANRELFQTDVWQKETHLVIFPGGRDIPYHEALKGPGNLHLADFVQNGGNFLGICAGGYYGSAAIEFEQGGPLEVLDARELKFFPGIARGPAYGPGKFCYQTGQGSQIAQLTLFPSALSSAAYFNGGCAFVNAEHYAAISVMARYTDIEGQPAAIVKCRVGAGRAILCGVHPEYSAFNHCSKKHISNSMLSALKQVESERRILFKDILSELNC